MPVGWHCRFLQCQKVIFRPVDKEGRFAPNPVKLFDSLDNMIGQFAFSPLASKADVVLELAWVEQQASGRVLAPDWVITKLSDALIPARADDEFLRLPYALSYSILVATFADVKLTITGDRSAWPEHWGALSLDRRSLRSIISH